MRKKIVEAILTEYRKLGSKNQEHVLEDALRHIASDANLIAFAQDLGIDTDLILEVPETHSIHVCKDVANHHAHLQVLP